MAVPCLRNTSNTPATGHHGRHAPSSTPQPWPSRRRAVTPLVAPLGTCCLGGAGGRDTAREHLPCPLCQPPTWKAGRCGQSLWPSRPLWSSRGRQGWRPPDAWRIQSCNHGRPSLETTRAILILTTLLASDVYKGQKRSHGATHKFDPSSSS